MNLRTKGGITMSTSTTYFKPPEGFHITKEIACGNTDAAIQKKAEIEKFFIEKKLFLKLFRREGWIFVCSKKDERVAKWNAQ